MPRLKRARIRPWPANVPGIQSNNQYGAEMHRPYIVVRPFLRALYLAELRESGMPILEQCEQVNFSVASRTRQTLFLTFTFIFAFIVFFKMGTSHEVWTIAVLLIAIDVGVSTLWSP
jgi:hypothetical protein